MRNDLIWYIRVVLIDNPMVSQKQTNIVSAWSDNEVLFNMYKSRLYCRYQNMDYDIVCNNCNFDELQSKLKISNLDDYKIILVSSFDKTKYALTQKICIDRLQSDTSFISVKMYDVIEKISSLEKFSTVDLNLSRLSKVNIGMTDNIMYLITHYSDICFEI